MENKTKTVTLKIEVWKALSHEAINRDMTLSELVKALLEEEKNGRTTGKARKTGGGVRKDAPRDT
jgi:macrodomain Ter protein organizer (MatP/YcbG family)